MDDPKDYPVVNHRDWKRVISARERGRFLRFITVGASGTLLDFILLTVFKTIFNLPTIIANPISYSAGVLNNFTWNRLWTYPESRSKVRLVQLGQFALVSTVGVTLNTLVVLALEPVMGTVLGSPDFGYIPAKVIATGTVALWNFLANRYWTFNDIP